MAGDSVREYKLEARSTDTIGRVLTSARNHHFIVDGPVENGCPGEAITPGELFLGGIATCGVELIQVLARAGGVGLRSVHIRIEGQMDLANRVREDVMVFNSVSMRFKLTGVTPEQGDRLVKSFKRR